LRQLFHACRSPDRELLLEVLPTSQGDPERFEIAAVIRQLYQIEIYPDWWKIECPPLDAEWEDLNRAIAEYDADCRGVILLGKGEPLEELRESLKSARKHKVCKGFAVGRSIFQEPIENWFQGACDDDQCKQSIEENFRSLIEAWESSS
jgi:5-dehydro-2-deoxygluconokinase